MKRWIPVLLAAVLLLLSGCKAAPEKPDDPPVTPPPVQEKPPVEEKIFYTVEMENRADEFCAEDGTELAHYRFFVPVLSAQRADGSSIETAETPREEQALAAVNVFNEEFADWGSEKDLQELADYALMDWEWKKAEGIEWFGSYVSELDCAVYQTDGLISVDGMSYSYTGGAHPNTAYIGWNFDLDAGAFISAPAIAAENVAFQDAVTKEIILQADAFAQEQGFQPEELFWADYHEIAANWSSYAVSFDENGMTVVFSPYDIAPYAAGPQIYTFSYEWMEPYLGENGRLLLGLVFANGNP